MGGSVSNHIETIENHGERPTPLGHASQFRGIAQQLIERLNHDEPRVREAATKELSAMGEDVVPMLRKALLDKDIDPESRILMTR